MGGLLQNKNKRKMLLYNNYYKLLSKNQQFNWKSTLFYFCFFLRGRWINAK